MKKLRPHKVDWEQIERFLGSAEKKLASAKKILAFVTSGGRRTEGTADSSSDPRRVLLRMTTVQRVPGNGEHVAPDGKTPARCRRYE
jgi:hypothetical protein